MEWGKIQNIMKKLGVIGGLGPMTTAYYMQMVIEMTEAETDQNHIEMFIHNCPKIPDRTSYILGKSNDNPGIQMVEVGLKLEEMGADVISIPCVTANYFYQELTNNIHIPVINTIRKTAEYVKEHNIKRVGLMATDGTVQAGLYTKEMSEKNIDIIIPKEKSQSYIMDIIYKNIKAGRSVDMNKFQYASEDLRDGGAEVILLGCTELSMVRRDEIVGQGYLDVLQLMAKVSVETCGNLKPVYKEIITK